MMGKEPTGSPSAEAGIFRSLSRARLCLVIRRGASRVGISFYLIRKRFFFSFLRKCTSVSCTGLLWVHEKNQPRIGANPALRAPRIGFASPHSRNPASLSCSSLHRDRSGKSCRRPSGSILYISIISLRYPFPVKIIRIITHLSSKYIYDNSNRYSTSISLNRVGYVI